MEERNYRILTLDGGGTWALIEVMALIALFSRNGGRGAETGGHAVLEQFDMVAANSGGSIVLGCLLEDFTLGEILDFFQTESRRRAVFSQTESFGDRALHNLAGLGPKYSADNKLPALQHILKKSGNLPLSRVAAGIRRVNANADLRLLITAFDYDRNRAKFFRSAAVTCPDWGLGAPANTTLAEAIHASTNAPVNYFDAPAEFAESRYWDGGLTGCNNPVLAAVAEAITTGQKAGNVVALSLGTATVSLPWPEPGEAVGPFHAPRPSTGLVADLRRLATSVLADPPDVSSFLAHVMTGGGTNLNRPPADSRVVRMNPLISPMGSPRNWSAPDGLTPAQFAYLVQLDMDAVEQPQVNAISHFADLWIQDKVRNQPVRMNTDSLAPEIGQPTFSAALNAWTAIRG